MRGSDPVRRPLAFHAFAYFNPRSPRGGATAQAPPPAKRRMISIHAPHEGERQTAPFEWRGEKIFQSTLPTRGSDYKDRTKYTAPTPISIHAPHEGERPAVSRAVIACSRISIHAPHEGERRISHGGYVLFFKISIHAPHEGERRAAKMWSLCRPHYFNPRSPRGGATRAYLDHALDGQFQSTLPTRGSDSALMRWRWSATNFNPRSPRGGATMRWVIIQRQLLGFQSTLPTRGSDAHAVLSIPIHRRISIHAPHEGERPPQFVPQVPAP